MKRQPSAELKKRLGDKLRLSRLKTAFKRRESASNITAPQDPTAGHWRANPDDAEQMNESEFERELAIPWKR